MPNISFLYKELLIMVTIESVSSLHVIMNMLYDFFRAERKITIAAGRRPERILKNTWQFYRWHGSKQDQFAKYFTYFKVILIFVASTHTHHKYIDP